MPTPSNRGVDSLRVLITAYGCFLIFAAAKLIVVNLYFDMEEARHGGPIGKPGIYAVGMMFAIIFAPALNLIFVVSTGPICGMAMRGARGTILAFALGATLITANMWTRWCRPLDPAFIAMRLTQIDGSSYGFGAIQTLAGIALLRFNKHIALAASRVAYRQIH